MVKMFVDKAALIRLMRQAGFGSQLQFAEAIGLSAPKLTNILKGKRRAQIDEAQRMAQVLRAPVAEVLKALNIQSADPWGRVRKLEGFVDDNERVQLISEISEEFGLHEVVLPFFAAPGWFFEVRATDLGPRFSSGDVLCLPYEDGYPHKLLLPGDVVIAKLAGGEFVIKLYHPGSTARRCNLLPLSSGGTLLSDVQTEWVSAVESVFPKLRQRSQLRKT